MNKSIHTNKAPNPVGAYPHARRVGDFLFLSGIGPRTAGEESNQIPGLEIDSKGNYVQFDFEKQCHSVFKNVQAVVEASGASWNDIVDVTVFLTDMKRDFNQFNAIYKEYFNENQPCRTTVEVSALPTPISIELKCIAYMGKTTKKT